MPVAEGAAGPLVGDDRPGHRGPRRERASARRSSPASPATAVRGGAVDADRRDPARAPGAGRDRADRSAHQHRAAAAAPPGAGAADRPPLRSWAARSATGTRPSPPSSTSTPIPRPRTIVFRSGVPITMMGLDVTHQALLDADSVERSVRAGRASGRIAAELTEYALDRDGRVVRGDHHGHPRCGGRRPPRDRAISSTSPPYHVTRRHDGRAGPRPDGLRRSARTGFGAMGASRTPRSGSGSTAAGSSGC